MEAGLQTSLRPLAPAFEPIAEATTWPPVIKTTTPHTIDCAIPAYCGVGAGAPLRLTAESAMENVRVLCSALYNRDANRGIACKA